MALKTVTKWGTLGALQTAYDTATTLVPATHGLRTTEPLNVQTQYSYDGKRPGKAPGTAARLGLVGPEGRFADATMKQEGAGGGAAYSSSIVPVPHLMLRLAGFGATLTATSGSESYAYAPADEDDYAYGNFESYERRQKFALLNAMVDTLEFGGELGQIPVWTAALKGTQSALPIDATIPVGIAYNATPGAKATQMQIALGDYDPVRVHEFKFSLKRGLQARAYDQANGRHGGFHPDVERSFTAEFLMENPTMPGSAPFHTSTAFNARALMEAATEIAMGFTVGATQYRKFSVAANQAVVESVTDEAKGALAMVRVVVGLFPSDETTNDECTITFN
jgi:hypothetical protein